MKENNRIELTEYVQSLEIGEIPNRIGNCSVQLRIIRYFPETLERKEQFSHCDVTVFFTFRKIQSYRITRLVSFPILSGIEPVNPPSARSVLNRSQISGML